MILKIEDYNGNFLCGLDLTENNINGNLEVFNTKGDVSIADIEFDNIFNTNDYMIRIQLDNINNRELKANEIIDDIISTRGGQGELYDEEILNMYVNDYFAEEIEKIKDIIDDKIRDYLDDDNLTIL